MAAKDLTGHTFGIWIVIGASKKSGYVKCRCKCGTERDVLRESLTRGASKSCGCVHTRSEAQLKMDERRKKRETLLESGLGVGLSCIVRKKMGILHASVSVAL